MAGQKRRSDRIVLTIPLGVEGTDADGTTFKEDACTVSVNRYGAQIRMVRRLQAGQTVRVMNRLTRRDAQFRVVGPATSPPDKSQEWGVECLNPEDNIWGIHFPPPEEGAELRGLLKCHKCHGIELLRLSVVEVDVLEATGAISRTCEACATTTHWGYTEGDTLSHPEADGDADLNFRRRRRVSLQLPLMIRKRSGAVEITKCENMSKGGLGFISEKHYFPGEAVVIACPYHAKGHNMEVEAHIVRQQPIEGSNRKIYGVRYLAEES